MWISTGVNDKIITEKTISVIQQNTKKRKDSIVMMQNKKEKSETNFTYLHGLV